MASSGISAVTNCIPNRCRLRVRLMRSVLVEIPMGLGPAVRIQKSAAIRFQFISANSVLTTEHAMKRRSRAGGEIGDASLDRCGAWFQAKIAALET
jgi:hypothetical protein